MSEQTAVVAESSPALSVVESGASAVLTSSMKHSWNKGEAPKIAEEKPQAESAPAKVQKQPEAEPSAEPNGEPGKATVSDIEPEAEAGKKPQDSQGKPEHAHKPKLTAEERIAQLEATIEKIRKGAGIERKTEVAPVKPEPTKDEPKPPQNYSEWRKTFKAVEWVEKWAKDNPQSTYEEAMAAMNDHMDEVREGFRQRDSQMREFQRQADAKLAEARGKYDNFDETAQSAARAIVTDDAVPMAVKQMLNDSEVFPDLIYTIGSKPEELQSFIQMAKTNPGKALRYIALTESLIQEELDKPAAKAPEKAKEEPAKPKTKASPPPEEVGGRSATPPDPEQAAVQSGDFRAAKALWTRKALDRLKK